MQQKTTLAEILMVITKMLFNKKGIALVILIIAMTLIAVLGAGIVSFMGTKQRSYPFQINSYRALNLANAGIECAIRFASDRDLFTNYSAYSYPNSTWTTFTPFGTDKGTFSISYDFDYTDTSDILYIRGNYAGINREVRLVRFRRYVSALTLVPNTPDETGLTNRLPYVSVSPNPPNNPIVIIPLMNNDTGSKIIDRVGLQITGGATKTLTKITINSVDVYTGSLSISPSQDINITNYNVVRTDSSATVCQFVLEFTTGDVLSGSQYILTYYFTDGTRSTVTFSL